MNEGLYIAASGGAKQMHKLDTISSNVSNAATQGFKRDLLLFNEIRAPYHTSPTDSLFPLDGMDDSLTPVSYVNIARSYTDFSQGSLINTGNPFDLALEGEGFFVLNTPQGERYTRNGSFQINPEGELVDSQGNPVVNWTDTKRRKESETIFIPPETKEITVDQEGLVYGEIDRELIIFGQIKIVTFQNNEHLKKEGNGLMRNTLDSNRTRPAEEVKVLQGYKETSNVNAIEEMTRMIETVRTLEAYQKVIQSFDEADEQSVNNLARVA